MALHFMASGLTIFRKINATLISWLSSICCIMDKTNGNCFCHTGFEMPAVAVLCPSTIMWPDWIQSGGLVATDLMIWFNIFIYRGGTRISKVVWPQVTALLTESAKGLISAVSSIVDGLPQIWWPYWIQSGGQIAGIDRCLLMALS